MTDPSQSDAQVKHYIELWKQTVTVQQHFNDIEWRIRGLALTAATFAIGAAAVATKDGSTFAGTLILLIALLLWYAFYFVDRYWYHPLLKASVDHGELIEDELAKTLPAAKLTHEITAASGVKPPLMIRLLTLKLHNETELRSYQKMAWFYGFGALALAFTAVGLGVISLSATKSTPEPTIVRIERQDQTVTVLQPTVQTSASGSSIAPASITPSAGSNAIPPPSTGP